MLTHEVQTWVDANPDAWKDWTGFIPVLAPADRCLKTRKDCKDALVNRAATDVVGTEYETAAVSGPEQAAEVTIQQLYLLRDYQ
jgi:hypothetical protein